MSHSGPFPHPSAFGGYEQVRPGTTDDIVEMAKADQEHKFSCDRTELEIAKQRDIFQYRALRHAQLHSSGLMILALGCAMACVVLGEIWAAALFVGLPVMSVIRTMMPGYSGNRGNQD